MTDQNQKTSSFGDYTALDIEKFINDEMPKKRSALQAELNASSSAFKSVAALLKVENRLFGVRQSIVDYKRELAAISKQVHLEKKELLYKDLMTEKSYKPKNNGERDIIKNRHTRFIDYNLDKLDIDIEWCADSIKSCDNMTNGISYTIKLINILGYTPK